LCELSGSWLVFSFGFDLLDDFADRFARGVPSRSSADVLGALVAGVGFAGQVSELLDLAPVQDIGDSYASRLW
jgi:hypothetical protein